MSRTAFGTFVSVVLVILVWPSDAHAWGPATHIDYGLEVLRNAALLSPFVRGILLRYSEDYLYGCCAADIVVGKNFAKELYHCHNWQVGFRVLAAADDDRKRALCYGFLTHLGADIIAHNFFVPYKTVESFRTRTAKHTYWELRFDREALARPHVWETLCAIGRHKFPDHDAFLEEQLAPSSRLFSFGTSRRIFSSMMLLSRLRQWQKAIAGVAERSPLPLSTDEVKDFRRLAVDAIFALLIDAEDSRTATIDPTGARSIVVAKDLRRELRELRDDGALAAEAWPGVADDLRHRFRAGIYGRLDVPDARTLVR